MASMKSLWDEVRPLLRYLATFLFFGPSGFSVGR